MLQLLTERRRAKKPKQTMISSFFKSLADKEVYYEKEKVYFFEGITDYLCIQEQKDSNDIVLCKIAKDGVEITLKGDNSFTIVTKDKTVNAFFELRGSEQQ